MTGVTLIGYVVSIKDSKYTGFNFGKMVELRTEDGVFVLKASDSPSFVVGDSIRCTCRLEGVKGKFNSLTILTVTVLQ